MRDRKWADDESQQVAKSPRTLALLALRALRLSCFLFWANLRALMALARLTALAFLHLASLAVLAFLHLASLA